MNITLFRGARGKGKTLTMVMQGLKFKSLGWKVYTNLRDTPFHYVTSEFILSLSGESMLKNAVLLIDEIEFFFDSREWNKKEARNFGRFLQQIRKRNVKILCTAQYTNLIDIRLRQQIDVMVMCSFDKIKNICSGIYYDLTSIESDPVHPLTYRFSFYAIPIFKYYNTNELI